MIDRKKRFGQKIKALRRARGLSQSDLARELFGLADNGSQIARGRATISRWESGTSIADEKNLILAAEFFGVPYEDLAGTPDAVSDGPYRMEARPGGKSRLVVDMVVPSAIAAAVIGMLAEAERVAV